MTENGLSAIVDKDYIFKKRLTSYTIVSNEYFIDDSFATIFRDKFFWSCHRTSAFQINV